ncbi:hypothetical protein K493DRAFT_311595 [Basidiobolus meristosporus CBS 931.73]|uniref:Uncharacterized protein n=1 Tax=Basidiobolus meristosporus CBS 931.73 TaxID=1314790 RepID=A0A1Y1Z1S2_9FUNG|nr:hypothetical protein K493DRAFT_311595 [Basidiobolus meristosporus CBS 931.73]|eukprot:ORY03785.1 hypothetical protein K493DRAFT_311595 [Basidiobolus meristosporus CBS 931.73]
MMTYQNSNLRKRLLGQIDYYEGSQQNKRHNTCPPDFQYSKDLELANAAPSSPHTPLHNTMEYLNLMKSQTRLAEPTAKANPEEHLKVEALGMDVDKNEYIELERDEALSKTATTTDRPGPQSPKQKMLVFGFQKDCSKCQRAVPGHYSHIVYRE